MTRTHMLYALAGAGAAVFLIFGLWPFFDAFSFYEDVADYPPFNAHFLHDVGAFQIGIGATLVLAMIWRSDALLVALAGAGVAAFFHFAAHVNDEELGGSTSQTVALGLFAALLLAGAVWQWLRGRDMARVAAKGKED